MKYLFLIILFLTLSFCGNSQSSFFEKQRGVKTIKHTKRAGDVKKPQFFYKSKEFFDEEGRLLKVHKGPKSEENYYYKSDTIIRTSTVADRTNAWFYFSKEEGNITYHKSGKYYGKGYWGDVKGEEISTNWDYPISGTLIYNDSFPDVERRLDLVDDFYSSMLISEYKNDSLIYFGLNYDLAKDSSEYLLSAIFLDEKIQEKFLFKQIFRIEIKGNKNIILNYQALLDEEKTSIKFLDRNKLFRTELEIQPVYKYEYDKKGNWLKRILVNPKPNRMEESYREFEYY